MFRVQEDFKCVIFTVSFVGCRFSNSGSSIRRESCRRRNRTGCLSWTSESGGEARELKLRDGFLVFENGPSDAAAWASLLTQPYLPVEKIKKGWK